MSGIDPGPEGRQLTITCESLFSEKADFASWPLNLRVCSYMRNPVISTHFCFETMPTLSHAQHHRHCNQLQVIFRAITIHPGPQTGKLGVALDSPLSPTFQTQPISMFSWLQICLLVSVLKIIIPVQIPLPPLPQQSPNRCLHFCFVPFSLFCDAG